MSKVISFYRENSSITFSLFDGSVVTASSDHPRWWDIVKLVKNNQVDEALEAANITSSINQYFDGTGVAITNDGKVTVNGKEVVSDVTDYLLQQYHDGYPTTGLAQFIERLEYNPDYRVRNQLFTFLKKSGFGLTPDGMFYAYKKVRGDYRDIYTGTMDNSPGTFVEMPRRDVNSDPNQTCSAGLHVCAHSYLQYYGAGYGNRIVKVLVDPANVVSIPVDYDNAKMRVSAYYVEEDITEEAREDILRATSDSSTFNIALICENDPVYHQTYGLGIVVATDDDDVDVSLSFGSVDIDMDFATFRDHVKKGIIDIE